MRSGRPVLVRVLAALSSCTAVLGARTALADPACAGPLSPCINDDTLWPHAGPARFVAVGSPDTVGAGQLGFGLVTSYLSRPIVFDVSAPGGTGTDEAAVNDQVNTTFLWAYGITHRLELDVAMPITLGQGGTGLAPITGGTGLRDTAVRDVRFGFAYEVVPHEPCPDGMPGSTCERPRGEWGLAARFETSAPTGDHDQFAGERSAVFIPTLAADYRNGRWTLGAEAGARLRPTSDLLQARVGSEILAALGVGYDILARHLLTASLEAWALPMLIAQGDGSTAVPAEWQLAVRTAPLRGEDLSIQLGGGGALESDAPITTPRFRFTLGVRWAPAAAEKAPVAR